jgi:hypothetical protein
MTFDESYEGGGHLPAVRQVKYRMGRETARSTTGKSYTMAEETSCAGF